MSDTLYITVREALDAGRYENNVPFTWEKVPVNDGMTIKQAREHKEEQDHLHREQRKKYQAENQRLVRLFRADLEREHGVVGNPKAALLWQIAWDDGHAYGYSEVCSHYEKLVDLIT